MRRIELLAVGMAALPLAGARQASAQYVLQNVIQSTGAVPGTALGEAWATSNAFSNSGIDNAGNVLFRGQMLGTNAAPGPGGVNGSNAVGYWYGAPGSLNLFARDGAAGPTLPNPNGWTHNAVGGTASGLGFSVLMSSNGTILASSQLNGTGAVANSNNTAFWTGPYNNMQMVAQRGLTPAAAPGTAGAAFASNLNLTSSKVNTAGQTLFNSTLTGGDTISGSWSTSNLTNDSGIWFGGPSGLSLLAREGDTAPGTGGAIFGDVTNIANHSINGAGKAAFVLGLRNATGAPGGVTSSNAAAWWTNATGSLSLVARASDPVPGLTGVSYAANAAFAGHTPQDFNNNNRLIYNASFGAGATSGVDSEAIMTWTPAGGSSVLYRTGSPVPGALGAAGATWKTFNGTNMAGRLNNLDMLAFASQIQGGGSTTSNDEMIWVGPVGGTPQIIAREGDPVPNLPGVNLGGAMINASGLIFNNLNEAAFTNTMSDGTVGLFVWDPTAGLSMLLHTTQSGVVPGLGTITNISLGNAGNNDGGSAFLSDTGWLTFTATDSSGASAIVRTMIPSPGSLAVLGLGGVLAMRRRR
jgi:MYXO-CTERM domain-containing protein